MAIQLISDSYSATYLARVHNVAERTVMAAAARLSLPATRMNSETFFDGTAAARLADAIQRSAGRTARQRPTTCAQGSR